MSTFVVMAPVTLKRGSSNGCFYGSGCFVRLCHCSPLGAWFPFGNISMTIASLVGWLLAAWVIGFGMGHTWKLFRRIIESA